jgi:AcrR family transcriptional regulator
MNEHSFINKGIKMADRETRKKQITAIREEQILKAATDIFVKKGYDAATIPEIARLCGTATGTIYIYYSSKRDLFIAVINALIVTPFISIFTNTKGEDFQSTLKEALNDRITVLKSDAMPSLIALMGEIQRDEELRVLFAEKMAKPFLSFMETVYREKIESGEFREFNPELIVRLIGSMTIGMTLLKNIEGTDSPLNQIPQEEIAEQVMNFILYGLVNTGEKRYNSKTVNNKRSKKG